LVRRSPVRSGAVLGALLLIAAAGAPLATRVWEAFWSLPHAGRVTLCAAGLAVILAATVRRPHLQWNRWRQRVTQARLGSLIALAWAAVVVIVGLLVTGTWWLMGAPALGFPDTLPPRALDTLATRAFAVVAGFGAAALLVIHYRRQRTTEADAERDVAKLFTDTFDSASDKLGSEHAAVRLAGVHALARLADEAPEGREDLVQMIIDVLCAYLRMPYTPHPDKPFAQPDSSALPTASSTTAVDLGRLRSTAYGDAQGEKQQAAQEEHRRRVLEFESFQQVRHTIIRIIGNRLREPTRWRGKDYDFTGVVFDGGDLTGAHFTGGKVSFHGAEFSDRAVDFYGARFSGGMVIFRGATFTGGVVSFGGARFTGGTVYFTEVEFSGGVVSFGGAEFSDGTVNFFEARFTGGQVLFFGAEFSGGVVSFGGAEFSDGTVNFRKARFTGRAVSFRGARFTGGVVSFGGAEFSDGTVIFRGARFTGGAVSFADVSGACPSGLLEAVERVEPGVVLPEQWRRAADSSGEEASETSADAPDH
jgi:uncharacterized protein YjbI with pentapeptide repeats